MSDKKKKKEKIIFLILGAVVGLVIGGAIVKYQSDFFSKQKNLDEVVSVLPDLFSKKGALPISSKFQTSYDVLILKRKKANEKISISLNDTLQFNMKLSENYYDENILGIDNSDSVSISNEMILTTDIGTNHSEIKKDEMIYSKKVTVENKSVIGNVSDSLINNNSVANYLTIEFWISPINYKGYKMSRNKLVLFGLTPTDNISIKKFDGELYLKYMNLVYKVMYSEDYKTYQMIVNDNILNKLK